MKLSKKYSNHRVSDKLLYYCKHDPEFCTTVLDVFSFLISDHNFTVDYMGLHRGWGLSFNRKTISVVVGCSVDEILPPIFIVNKNENNFSYHSIEDLMKELKFKSEPGRFEHSENYKKLGIIKSYIYKLRYDKNIKEEFWLKIREAGNFIEGHFNDIMGYIHNQRSIMDIP